MKILRRASRGFFFFALSGCLLGLSISSDAQDLTVTPAVPEAYQPFTIRGQISCPLSSEESDSDVYVRSDGIVVEIRRLDPGFVCPVMYKTAVVNGLPGGTYPLIYRGRDWNEPDTDPLEEVTGGEVVIAPAPPTQPVFAFYNDGIGHYFITAGTAERDSLLSGGGGGGWGIVDEGFNAWPAAGPAPTAAKPVCRFYSAVVNSHFYTAGANECELLKQPGSGWTYEGIAFRALVPTKGSCYPGTTPVWRLYNDRFAQADSNHRFVVSPDTYRHMIANGWIGEGVAFCSPES